MFLVIRNDKLFNKLYSNLNVWCFNQVKTITLTTLAFPVEAVGAIENSDEDIIELFLSVNVSENHRSGCIVHSIGVLDMKVIGRVTTPFKLNEK